MQEAFIANCKKKNMSIFIVLLIMAQIICFLIGRLIVPNTTISRNILAKACKKNRGNNSESVESEKWYYTIGKKKCEIVNMFIYGESIEDKVYQVIYATKIPSQKNKDILDYSKWHQNLIGILHIDILFQSDLEISPRSPILFDARLAYRNKGDPIDDWKPYAALRVSKTLECSICEETRHYNYDCMPIPLFQLGPLYHDYYLLNIHFPHIETEENINKVLGYMSDLWLTVINRSGSNFIKIWINLQSIFFSIVVGFLIWYWRQIYTLSRPPTNLEYMVLTFGCTMSFLNIPLEYLMIYSDMSTMFLVIDVKQHIFFAVILWFWLIFVSEHLMIQNNNSLINYWCHVGAVSAIYLSLFMYNIYGRIIQLYNPFFFTSIANIGTEYNFSFITLTGILAGVYLLLLGYIIYKIFDDVNLKKAVLPSISIARRSHSENLIYRFKILMIVTLLCALLTIIGLIFSQMIERRWKWSEDYELDKSSMFFIDIYGMWNIYTIALLCLYAPLQPKTISLKLY